MGVLIGVYNRTDAATVTGGSWTASLPVTNIQTRLLAQVARTTDASNASSIIKMDLGAGQVIKLISLVNHNISLDGSFRIRAGGTSAVADYDSGVITVWPTVYAYGVLEWENPAWWSGTYSPEEISGYTTNACYILPAQQVFQYWQIEIFDSTNPAGYIQVGRVFIGSGWTPVNDAETGANIGWETNTQMQKALNGTKYYQSRTPLRVTNFVLNVMSVDEAMSNAFEIDRRTGIDKEVFFVFDTNDTFHALRRRYLGTLRQLTPVEFPYNNLLKKAYTVEEVV